MLILLSNLSIFSSWDSYFWVIWALQFMMLMFMSDLSSCSCVKTYWALFLTVLHVSVYDLIFNALVTLLMCQDLLSASLTVLHVPVYDVISNTLVTLPSSFQFLSSEIMPRKAFKLSFIIRRQNTLSSLDVAILTMRSCKSCVRYDRWCRLSDDSDKCVKCVRVAISCDLAPLNVAKWKRLEVKRKKLKIELRETCAKQQRLLQQINSLESQQKKMIDAELRNIEEWRKRNSRRYVSILLWMLFLSKSLFLRLIRTDSFLRCFFLIFSSWPILHLMKIFQKFLTVNKMLKWFSNVIWMWVFFPLDKIFLIFSFQNLLYRV